MRIRHAKAVLPRYRMAYLAMSFHVVYYTQFMLALYMVNYDNMRIVLVKYKLHTQSNVATTQNKIMQTKKGIYKVKASICNVDTIL